MIGQNGIIEKAKQAKELYEKSAKAENTAMDELVNKMEQYNEGNSTKPGAGNTVGKPDNEGDSTKPGAGNTVEKPDNEGDSTKPGAGDTVAKPEKWTSTQVTPISDGNGGTVPLPNGFHYVRGDYNTGLVISDKQNDDIDASGVNMGNQFVWIPVASEADLERTLFDRTTGHPRKGLSTDYTEPYKKGYSTEESEYNTMKEQVLKYGGFYIGRFEAGVNNITPRTAATTEQTIVCKKGVAPYDWVPWGTSMSDASEISGKSGAVYLAKNFASQHNYTSVTSTLTYGCQWDAMCRYIGDSQRTAPKKNSVEVTGSVVGDVSKNIYDLAGNCWEWTMEAYYLRYESERVIRGGGYDVALPVSNRASNNPGNAGCDYNSFRLTLYIK